MERQGSHDRTDYFREALLQATQQLQDVFARLAQSIREIFAPGTFLGDYSIVTSQRVHETDRTVALERLATRLGAYPVEPTAKGALLRLATLRGVRPEIIIKELSPIACLLAIGYAHELQVIREGKGWIKTGDGRKAPIVPTEHYRLSKIVRFEKYLKQKVRNLIEEELIGRAFVTCYEPIEYHLDRLINAETATGADAANEQDRLLDLLDQVLSPADRDLLERSENEALGTSDRKRLERLRKKVRTASRNGI